MPSRHPQRRRGSRATLRHVEHRQLGRTGVEVTPLCLGAMMFGAWGNTDHDDSIRIIHEALDAGINFIDTADVYSRGESERIVGKALKGRRDNVARKNTAPVGSAVPLEGAQLRRQVRREPHELPRLVTSEPACSPPRRCRFGGRDGGHIGRR